MKDEQYGTSSFDDKRSLFDLQKLKCIELQSNRQITYTPNAPQLATSPTWLHCLYRLLTVYFSPIKNLELLRTEPALSPYMYR